MHIHVTNFDCICIDFLCYSTDFSSFTLLNICIIYSIESNYDEKIRILSKYRFITMTMKVRGGGGGGVGWRLNHDSCVCVNVVDFELGHGRDSAYTYHF